MEFRAEARYMRVSPQKARLVLNLIRGQRVEDARNTLAFTKKRVAATVGKLLQSALDNANFLSTEKGLDVDRRQPVCKACGRQRWAAHEAHSSGADGTRLSLRAAHRAHRNRAGGAEQERRADRAYGGRREQGLGSGEAAGQRRRRKRKRRPRRRKQSARKRRPRNKRAFVVRHSLCRKGERQKRNDE